MAGKPVGKTQLSGQMSFRLAKDGPEIVATVQGATQDDSPMLEEYYLNESSLDDNAGDRTIFVRKAFKQIRRRHRYRTAAVIAISSVLLLSVGFYALLQRAEANRQRERAQQVFYDLKARELATANAEETWLRADALASPELIRRNRTLLAEKEADYERFLKEMGLYNDRLSEEDRLIYRVTRVFGEWDLGMPTNYVDEVKRYIGFWKASDRLADAIAVSEGQGYAPRISSALLAQNLPPQFFYLALQESNFDPYASGPRTYKGIAKGMWQFIPETAVKYGLHVGPLADLPRRDPADERQDFERSTQAAARYLKFIYSTDAQASALLVMASYNWGEHNIIPLLQRLPANPRDRNFWRLLSAYKDKVPKETYDYVFSIVSAAVIGENPRLFGFQFENPLRHLETGGIGD